MIMSRLTKAIAARGGRLRSVRARTTFMATTIVALALIGAVAALANAVEQSLVNGVVEQGERQVKTVARRLAAGAPPAAALRPAQPVGPSEGLRTYVAILDEEGHPVVGSGFFAIPGVRDVSLVRRSGDGSGVVRVGSSDLAVAQRAIEVDGRLLYVVAASPLAVVIRSVDTIIWTSRIGIPLLIAFVGLITWKATGRMLRPIERIRAEVDDMSSQTLDRRVPEPDTEDEVARLAQTMNRMLTRLEKSHARQREFVSDASHELRSPVTAMRAELEVALAHPSASNWRDVATGVLEETARIERLVDDMLLLAQLDEGAEAPAQLVDIGSIVHKAVGHIPDVELRVDIADGLMVRGRENELASVVRNLLDNAVRHATSSVVVTATAVMGKVVITVDDNGPGVPQAQRERVFQRFTRLDEARSRGGGGVGLGLAVVDRVVRHHDGSVAIEDSPDGGARFKVLLPGAP
jgi:signal transduction histidine kinase